MKEIVVEVCFVVAPVAAVVETCVDVTLVVRVVAFVEVVVVVVVALIKAAKAASVLKSSVCPGPSGGPIQNTLPKGPLREFASSPQTAILPSGRNAAKPRLFAEICVYPRSIGAALPKDLPQHEMLPSRFIAANAN